MACCLTRALPIRCGVPSRADVVFTAYEMGWSRLSNGDLLAAAESQFDAFVTTDKNFRYQQNLVGRHLAILVLPFAKWPRLRNSLRRIVSAVDSLTPGDYMELALP